MLGDKLDEKLIQEVLIRARQSPRRRANHAFHQPTDRLQRMVNAACADSYFAPHRHKDPDKLEIFTILKGRAMVIAFTDTGEVEDRVILDAEALHPADGAARQVEIPAGVWHALLILSPEAALYEVIDGYYDARTHKRFAPWAPPESDVEAARAYLEELRRRCGAV